MESTIAAQCIVEQDTGLVLDMAGNKLPAGSVIMCKLTAFVIMEDGDIDYVGGSKMEMVYQADNHWKSPIWQMFNTMVNMFLFIVLMWRHTNTLQIISMRA